MKKIYTLLLLVVLPALAFAQAQLCQDQLAPLPGTLNVGMIPPLVSIKNSSGTVVKVPIAGSYACHLPGALAAPPVTALEGAAGNCHAYALYVGHNAPFHGAYKIVMGAATGNYTSINNCSLQAKDGKAEITSMLQGFTSVSSAMQNTAGTVIVYKNAAGDYIHSAISKGGGMLRQVNNIVQGVYEETTIAAMDAVYGTIKSYYVLTTPYSANPSAGVLTLCPNIKKCDDTASISGPTSVCNGASIQLNGSSGLYSYAWTLGPHLNTNALSGASVTPSANYTFPSTPFYRWQATYVQLQFQRYACSTPKTTVKNFDIENKNFPVTLTPVTPCAGTYYNHLQLHASANASNIVWQVPAPGYQIQSGQGTYNLTYKAGTVHGGYALSYTNHCGSSGTGGVIMLGQCGGFFAAAPPEVKPGRYSLTAYPTDVKDNLNLTLIESEDEENSFVIGNVEDVKIRIINSNGEQVYQGNLLEKDVNLVLQGFRPGGYFLEINAGGKRDVKRFFIE